MELLNIYRHEPDGSLSWITSVGSVKKWPERIIHSSAVSPSDEFFDLRHRRKEKESPCVRTDIGCQRRTESKEIRKSPLTWGEGLDLCLQPQS